MHSLLGTLPYLLYIIFPGRLKIKKEGREKRKKERGKGRRERGRNERETKKKESCPAFVLGSDGSVILIT